MALPAALSAPEHAPNGLERAILEQLQAVGGTCDSLAALPLAQRVSLAQRRRACTALGDRGWITYTDAIAQVGLTLAGKTLMGLDLAVWPVTLDERLVLRSCRGGRIHPAQIHPRVPGRDRQRLLAGLAHQGLIVVYERAIVELRLTPWGRTYLANQALSSAPP